MPHMIGPSQPRLHRASTVPLPLHNTGAHMIVLAMNDIDTGSGFRMA